MRQRRPKNLEEKINAYADYLIRDPSSYNGRWRSAFNVTESTEKKLYLEIGSGKGRFINNLALANAHNLFVGFEGQDTVVIRILEKIKENQLSNLKVCQFYINNFQELFDKNELDGIYLNFSDPWPKERHEKRRLTSKAYLDGYSVCLKPSGFIKMKTDNVDLFEYSIKQFEKHSDFQVKEKTDDLHNSQFFRNNIMTEYEKKFSNLNKKINYLCACRG